MLDVLKAMLLTSIVGALFTGVAKDLSVLVTDLWEKRQLSQSRGVDG